MMKKQNTWLWLPVLLGALLFLGAVVNLESHSAFAKPNYGANCLTCHKQSKQENTKPAKPANFPKQTKGKGVHAAGFLTTHGSEVISKGGTSCIQCHQTTNFCSSCHRKTVQPVSWDQRHKEKED